MKDWKDVKGWFTKKEGEGYETVLKSLTVKGCVVEVGIYCGRSSVLAAVTLHGTGRILHCIDCWDPKFFEEGEDNEKEARKNLAPFKDKVKIYKAWSEDIANKWPAKRKIACVFIDGHHTYASARSDIDNWLPLISFGGVICGHDYGKKKFPGVTKAVDETFSKVKTSGSFWWTKVK